MILFKSKNFKDEAHDKTDIFPSEVASIYSLKIIFTFARILILSPPYDDDDDDNNNNIILTNMKMFTFRTKIHTAQIIS
jgi:hypothetical protein